MKTPERIMWVVELLEVRPDDRLLEIGCGTGMAVYEVCERLISGSITAIDQSVKMSAAARTKNAANISSGRAAIRTISLARAKLPPAGFNKIFVVNLNVFWMDPRDELQKIKDLLAPGGTFFTFHRPPPGHELREYASAFQKNLNANRFSIFDVVFNRTEQVFSVCIKATVD